MNIQEQFNTAVGLLIGLVVLGYSIVASVLKIMERMHATELALLGKDTEYKPIQVDRRLGLTLIDHFTAYLATMIGTLLVSGIIFAFTGSYCLLITILSNEDRKRGANSETAMPMGHVLEFALPVLGACYLLLGITLFCGVLITWVKNRPKLREYRHRITSMSPDRKAPRDEESASG